MASTKNPNLDLLLLAVDRLADLADELVFLGGCATGLLITDPAAPPLRVTRDVDAIVHVASRADYYQLCRKLRARGFREDMSDEAPLCRWIAENVVLDVMPTDSRILGFSNKWYATAIENSEERRLSNGRCIRMVSAPYFLATKLEAFDGRGRGDYLASHDIEDIVAVLDGRREIVQEIERAPPALVKELSDRFQKLSKERRFIDAVSGHMPTDGASQARVSTILETIKNIAST